MLYFHCIAVSLTLLTAWPAQGVDTFYGVGNSLLADSQPNGIAMIAASRGKLMSVGYQINAGQTLDSIWNNPNGYAMSPPSPYGTYDNALPNYDWNFISLEPFPGKNTIGTTTDLATDTSRILDFINTSRSNGLNANTTYYVYATWPAQNLGSYQTVWAQSSPNQDTTPSLQTAAYFCNVLQRVQSSTTANVRMIPVGYVLNELDKRLQANPVSVCDNDGNAVSVNSVSQLYRDSVHMGYGSYVAGITTYSTLYGQDPEGIIPAFDTGYSPHLLSEDYFNLVNKTVWDVVTSMQTETRVHRKVDFVGTKLSTTADGGGMGAEILNSGRYEFAWNVGGTTTTVNGVTFYGNPENNQTGSAITIQHTVPFTNQDTEETDTTGQYAGTFHTLMNSAWSSESGANKSFQITMENLSIGQQYRVQFLFDKNDLNSIFHVDSDGNAISVNTNGMGRSVVATFTADSTKQAFTFTTDGLSSSQAYLNAVSIYAIPEPCTLLTGVSGLFSLLLYGWWKRKM